MITEVEQGFRAVDRTARPRYRRLPRGPSGMAREQIARNQRARLYGGMVDSVVRHGYDATTVAEVIGLAGVSRRAFYEHFRDKEECLSATHINIVGNARSRMIAALGLERGWANCLYAACRILFADVRSHPRGAHLVLVDSPGIVPGARERTRLANLAFERLLYAALRAGPQSRDMLRLEPCAIVGGVRHVAFTRVREHREHELETLADEVLDWIESYRSSSDHMPAPRPQLDLAPAQKPASFLQREDPHARILSATARLIRQFGYANVTDSQLARSARLPTQALHRQFPNKEACFLAVINAFITETLEPALSQPRKIGAWPTEVHQTMTTYVDYLAAHQALMRLAFVDLFDVGPAMVEQMMKPVEQLITLLTDIGPSPVRGPTIAREAITGAVWATIFRHVASDHAAQLPALADQLTFIVLAPHIGATATGDELLVNRKSHAA